MCLDIIIISTILICKQNYNGLQRTKLDLSEMCNFTAINLIAYMCYFIAASIDNDRISIRPYKL